MKKSKSCKILSYFPLFVVLIWLFSKPIVTFSQDLSHYKLDYENGLPSNEVYQTLQDNFGFIWIASDAGLFRYDGIRFVEFSSKELNSRSVSNLKLDAAGSIWCQNFTGQILLVKSDSITVFYDGSKKNSQYPLYTIDQKNRIWISSDDGILIYSKQQKKIAELKKSKLSSSFTTIGALQYDKNRVIVADLNSNFYSISTENFQIKKLTKTHDIGSRNIFFPSSNNLILFSEQNPIRKYFKCIISGDKVIRKEIIEPIDGKAIHYFYKTINGYDFMGTSNGLLYKKQSERIYKHCFIGKKISDIKVDLEGDYWLTTLQDGIIVIPSLDIFTYLKSNSNLSDDNLSHLSAINNQLYVGTYSGDLFQIHQEKLQYYQKNETAKYRTIRKVLNYRGNLIIACGPLIAKSLPGLNELGTLNNIRDMLIFDDKLFFTTPDRSGYVDLKLKNYPVKIIRKRGGKKLSLDAKNKCIYIAGTDGLFGFKDNKLFEIQFDKKPIFATLISYYKNALWVGSMNKGFFKIINPHTTKRTFKQQKNIIGIHIRSFTFHENTCWVATEEGLNKIDLYSNSHSFYNEYDGINLLEINDLIFSDNKIYLATIRGLTVFPANLDGRNSIAPKIKITSVKIGNKTFSNPKNIHLNYQERDVLIQFQSSALKSRGAYYYEYRIRNYATNWKKTSSNTPFVSIPGLPGGKYTFEVRALNEDGVKSQTTCFLDITVATPFYFSWWFYLLIFLFIFFLIASFFNYRLKYLKKKSDAKNQLLNSQLTALKAQMNPHFMYNTLSSIQDFIWQNDTKKSNYYLSKFSLLMRKILDASDQNRITIAEEIELLELYLELEQLRFGDSFNYSIDISKEILLDSTFIPAMIIQPFVENALKHGLLHKSGEKTLQINFSIQNKELHCVIIDNGIGREKANEIKKRQNSYHKSFATTATKKRIDLLSLYDSSNYNCVITDLYSEEHIALGTKVEITMPIYKS